MHTLRLIHASRLVPRPNRHVRALGQPGASHSLPDGLIPFSTVVRALREAVQFSAKPPKGFEKFFRDAPKNETPKVR
jgi:hypothetical protein